MNTTPRLDCREGCSYCCRKPGVLVTVPELLRIVQHVQDDVRCRERLPPCASAPAVMFSSSAGRSFDEPTDESVPCPLLSDERCTVYEIRPLTCRGYNSTSVDACRKAHESTNVLVPIFALIKDVTDGTTVGAAAQLREIGFNHSLVDLGTALNIAFEAGESFSQAVISGNDALLPAENATWVDALWTQVRETAQQIGVDIPTERR